MKRGVAVILISIAVWLVSLGMMNAEPRGVENPVRASLAPPSAPEFRR